MAQAEKERIRNMAEGVIGITDDGYPIVTGGHACPLWEGCEDGFSMRECWYCKYADFRKSIQLELEKSICRHPKNRVSTGPY